VTQKAFLGNHARRKAIQTKLFTQLPGLALAVMLTLLVGQGLGFGHDDGDGAAPRKLEGTWHVTLKISRCDAECPCPPGVTTDTPIPTLNTFLRHGAFLRAGNSFLVGPGQGSWKHTHHQAEARYTFLLFTPAGAPRGYEEVTKDIHLTGPDTFGATGTVDRFIDGNRVTPEEGCPISETATRFE
jgi:hypothetical protein